MAAEQKRLGFAETFMLGGIAAGIAKTAAAPLERVMFLQQSSHELVKLGKLATPYTVRVMAPHCSRHLLDECGFLLDGCCWC